ncbi:MAG: hypothetical protein ABIL06_22095 [Pseudomonadota bacterium]
MLTDIKKKDLLACLLLASFCLYLFRDIILAGHRLIGDDFIGFYLGMKKFFFVELWTHRSIPYWNPSVLGGIPFWAHFESTIFYPLGFLFWLVSPDRAYGYTMFIHLLLAGFFMYLLARSLGLGRAGSLVAGAVFTCNGFIMALLYLGHMCPVQSYIWLPAVLLLLNRALTSRTPYMEASIAGLLWGLQILAGAPQDAFYTFLAAMLFLLCSVTFVFKTQKMTLKFIAIPFLLFAIGAGVSSIQIIPALEFINESVRAGLDSYEMVTQGSYPLEGIITTLMPHFFGYYADSNVWVSNIPWSIPQQSLYVGILPLFLLFFIPFRHSESKRIVLFGIVLAATALILAFGHHTPVYKIAYLFPGFDRFRAPSKIIVLWVFSVGLLAGKGMDGLLITLRNRISPRLVFFMLFATALLVLDGMFRYHKLNVLDFFSPFILNETIPHMMADAANIIRHEFHNLTLLSLLIILFFILMTRGRFCWKVGAVSLCALLLVDLAHSNGRGIRPDHTFYPQIENIKRALDESIGKDKDIFRVGSYKFGLGPNLEMYLGYQTVGGFTALFPSRYYEFINSFTDNLLPVGWQSFSYGVNANHVFMDLLNVKYGIFFPTKSYDTRETCLPRAFIVPGFEISEKKELLDQLKRPGFEPTRTILFEEDHGFVLPGGTQTLSSIPTNPSRVRIVAYRPDYIALETFSRRPAFLFLSEIFYPGWKAFVDERPTRILRGNYLFRVIEIPAGRHMVHFVFDPLSIKVGIGVTVFTLFMLLNVIVYRFSGRIPFLRKTE